MLCFSRSREWVRQLNKWKSSFSAGIHKHYSLQNAVYLHSIMFKWDNGHFTVGWLSLFDVGIVFNSSVWFCYGHSSRVGGAHIFAHILWHFWHVFSCSPAQVKDVHRIQRRFSITFALPATGEGYCFEGHHALVSRSCRRGLNKVYVMAHSQLTATEYSL